jgi:hypothetical protein
VIRRHVALVRQLQAFMEGSALPWGAVVFKYDKDDDGKPIYEPGRAEMSFTHRGRKVEVVIMSPSEERGENELPLGRLAARFEDGEIIKGPIDQAVWDRIVSALESKSV